MSESRFFMIQVHGPDGWFQAGKLYRSKEVAKSWRPFVKSYWHGWKVRVKAVTRKATDVEVIE